MNNKNLIITTLVILSSILVYLNFFHINNYEDCVLNKMKGQNKNLTNIAIKACKREFSNLPSFQVKQEDNSLYKYLEHVVGVMAVFGLAGTAASYIVTKPFKKLLPNKLELRFLFYSISGCLIGPVGLFVTGDQLGPKLIGDVFIYFIVGMIVVWLLFLPLYGIRQIITHKNKRNDVLS